MVKNTTGGKKSKGAKSVVAEQKELVMAMEGQTYGLVTKMLGDRRIMVKLSDNTEIMAVIPGKFKDKKNWVTAGCHVLLNLREYQSSKADVAYVYSPTESKRLIKIGEIGEKQSEDVQIEEREISFDEL